MKSVTPFMMELHKDLKSVRGIADVTASHYIRNLYSLNSELSFNNLAWLKNKDSVELRIAEYAESTQKSLLSTIVSTLSLFNHKPAYKRIFTYWYNRMMDKDAELRNKDSSVKSPAQEKNWLSWDVILSHEKRLKEEVDKVMSNKNLTTSDWNSILSYMVLSLYTKFSPRRNQDYQFMQIVKTEKQANNSEFNYYIIDTNKFVFNKYKTASTHGQQVFDVPEDLIQVIELYLKRHPGGKKGFFLVQNNGTPLPSVNSITRILNKIFGKNVGSTMMRHIYLSNKYDVKEMDEDAEKMGHNGSMQREYMKVDVPTI